MGAAFVALGDSVSLADRAPLAAAAAAAVARAFAVAGLSVEPLEVPGVGFAVAIAFTGAVVAGGFSESAGVAAFSWASGFKT